MREKLQNLKTKYDTENEGIINPLISEVELHQKAKLTPISKVQSSTKNKKKETQNSVIPKGIKLSYYGNGPRHFRDDYNDNQLISMAYLKDRRLPYSNFAFTSSPKAVSPRASTSPAGYDSAQFRPRVVYDSQHVHVKYAKKNNFGSEKDIASFTEEDANQQIALSRISLQSACTDYLGILQKQQSKMSQKGLKMQTDRQSNKSLGKPVLDNEFTKSVKSSIAFQKFIQGDVKEFYKPNNSQDQTLIFESRFESGNLRRAIQTGPYEYDLIMNPDLGTGSFMQWYYFRVTNTRKNKYYTLNIINHMKPEGLYNEGMKPLMYSVKESEFGRYGWSRVGENIKYFTNSYHKPNLSRINGNGLSGTSSVYMQQQGSGSNDLPPYFQTQGFGNFASLSFRVSFKYDNDTVYFSQCYPYPYSQLRRFLNMKVLPGMKDRVKRSSLGQSLAGNEMDQLLITNFKSSSAEIAKRKAIILTGRVHPGETPGSFVIEGAMSFLLGDSDEAKELRNTYIFKIVPMLNPDGVVVGNARVSMSGKDLNRQWLYPSQKLHPEIYLTKQMIKKTGDLRKIELFCDFHGHSKKKNVFMFGCSTFNYHQKPDDRFLE